MSEEELKAQGLALYQQGLAFQRALNAFIANDPAYEAFYRDAVDTDPDLLLAYVQESLWHYMTTCYGYTRVEMEQVDRLQAHWDIYGNSTKEE